MVITHRSQGLRRHCCPELSSVRSGADGCALHRGRRGAGRVVAASILSMAIAIPGLAADRAVRYTVDGGTVHVVTDVVLSDRPQPFRKSLVPGSQPGAVRVTDRRTGTRVRSTIRSGTLEFRIAAEPGSKAEPRARIEETSSAALYWNARGNGFVFSAD